MKLKTEIVKNDLFDYTDRYIYQRVDSFKFSLDSILLAEFVTLNKNIKNILDLCTGNAPIPLILSKYTNASITGFEIQKDIYDLAIKSVDCNKLNNQIKIINDDINNIDNYKLNKFDIITCNPPFYKIDNENDLNKSNNLSIARHEIMINLDEIFKVVDNYLKDNGTFYMVHRLERIDEIVLKLNEKKLKLKEIQLIITKNDSAPNIALFKIKKHAKPGVKINKIINVNELDTYQKLFKDGSI